MGISFGERLKLQSRFAFHHGPPITFDIMAMSTIQVKNLESTFSVGKTMESDGHSNFLRGSEGGAKRRRKIAGKSLHDVLPSSASIFSDLTGLPTDGATSTLTEAEGMKLSKNLPETNIGFKLLKKSGWKEGSGLGISEQGRLNPLEPQFKSDRRGIGAEKDKQKTSAAALQEPPAKEDGRTAQKATKKEKRNSKKARKLKAEVERMQEQAFEREFYREFWPENV